MGKKLSYISVLFLGLFPLGCRFAAAFCKSTTGCSLLLHVPVLRNKPEKIIKGRKNKVEGRFIAC